MPPSSRMSIDDDIFGKHLPDDHIYDDLTYEHLAQVYETLQEDTAEGYYSLLIIDDFQQSLKDKNIVNMLGKIIVKMRHLRCSVILLQQNLQALAKPLRELISNIICFDIGKSQLTKVFHEIAQLPRENFDMLVNYAFEKPHDWLLVNLHKSKSVYKGFDRIVF